MFESSQGTSIAGLPLKLYNNDHWLCWIAPVPYDCYNGLQLGGDFEDTVCKRGEYAYIYRFMFGFAPLCVGFTIMLYAMYLVYDAVLRTEKATDKYITPQFNISDASSQERKFAAAAKHNRKRSRKVAKQCLYFVGAFWLAFGFSVLGFVIMAAGIVDGVLFDSIHICVVTTVPLQGFCNVFIYLRPRYEHFRRRYKDLTSWQIWAKIVRESLDNNGWCNSCAVGCCSSDNRIMNEVPISKQPLSQVSSIKESSGHEVVTSIAEYVIADGNDQNVLENNDEEEIDDDAIDDVNHNVDTESVQEVERRMSDLSRQPLRRIRRLSDRLSSPFGNIAFPRASFYGHADVDGGDIISDQEDQRRDNNDVGSGCEGSQQERALQVQEQYQQHGRTCEGNPEEIFSEDSLEQTE